MKICLKCNQNCTDAEEVCQRCGGNQFRYIGPNGEQQRPPMAGQNLGVNRQRPPMSSQLNKNRMNNSQAGTVGQNQGVNQNGFNPQRPMGQRPNTQGFGAQRPQQTAQGQMGQNMGQSQMGQSQMGQRPRQLMNPNTRGNMGQNQMGQSMGQNQMGQRPNVSQRNVNDNPFADNSQNVQNGNVVTNNRSVPMTQLQEGDLPPKPDVQNLPPKEAKQVMKEWQKKVALQAKENKKLAKQQQDAVKKVEQLKKKGKPVPPELEQLAAGAAIEAAHKNSRNNVTNVRGQKVTNEAVQEGVETGSQYEYTEETVTLAEWFKHILICIIPIYNIIYLIKIVIGSKDSKPSLKEFAKLQLIFLIAAVVIQIAAGLIMNIVMQNMW